MGDHRFSFKAEFEMHGVKEEINLGWCNWSGGRCGIDSRVSDWLENAVSKAFNKFDSDYLEYCEKRDAGIREIEERKEFARLQEKYGSQS